MAPQNKAGLGPQPQFTEVKCSVDLFNKLVSYIHGQPYSQVTALIEDIKNGFRPVMPAPVDTGAKEATVKVIEKDVAADPHAKEAA